MYVFNFFLHQPQFRWWWELKLPHWILKGVYCLWRLCRHSSMFQCITQKKARSEHTARMSTTHFVGEWFKSAFPFSCSGKHWPEEAANFEAAAVGRQGSHDSSTAATNGGCCFSRRNMRQLFSAQCFPEKNLLPQSLCCFACTFFKLIDSSEIFAGNCEMPCLVDVGEYNCGCHHWCGGLYSSEWQVRNSKWEPPRWIRGKALAHGSPGGRFEFKPRCPQSDRGLQRFQYAVKRSLGGRN